MRQINLVWDLELLIQEEHLRTQCLDLFPESKQFREVKSENHQNHSRGFSQRSMASTLHKKKFIPTCHYCYGPGHIRPYCRFYLGN